MSVVSFIGFERGQLIELYLTSGGNLDIVADPARSGTYSFQVYVDSSTVQYGALGKFLDSTGGTKAGLNLAAIYASVFVYIEILPAAWEDIISIYDTTSLKIKVEVNSDGTLRVVNKSGSVAATGTTVLSTEVWYRLDLSAGTGAADQPFELRINGATEVSGTCTQGTNNCDTFRMGMASSSASEVLYYFDDCVICDDAFLATDYMIPRTLLPDGDGAYTGWTGTYVDVDEVPANSSDYISSATTSDAVETVTIESISGLIPSGSSILGVIGVAFSRRSSGACLQRLILRTYSSDYISSGSASITTLAYVVYGALYELNPFTSDVWTPSEVDGVEFGVQNKSTEANSIRCTAISIMLLLSVVAARRVSYTPHAGI